jgi:predicted ArsR family transcriptional regulator
MDTPQPLRDRPSPVSIGTRRAAVLAVLRGSADALSVQEIADRTGLHVNTARFHLDALVSDGLAERRSEPRETPGRPRVLYRAGGTSPGPRSFGLLAEMLTGLVAALDGAGPAAVEAGRQWGRHLVDRPAPSEQVGAADAVDRLNRVLDEIGFRPELRRGTDGTEVLLHHCPFREVAARHTDVVCALHLGLMQGALAELRAPLQATSLEPFVGPDLCVARILEESPS